MNLELLNLILNPKTENILRNYKYGRHRINEE